MTDTPEIAAIRERIEQMYEHCELMQPVYDVNALLAALAERDAEIERLEADFMDKARAWDMLSAKNNRITELEAYRDHLLSLLAGTVSDQPPRIPVIGEVG